MHRLKAIQKRWTSTLLCGLMLGIAPVLAMPSTAEASGEKYCYCSGWECGSPTDPWNFFRWCCRDFPYECGCTIATNCGPNES